MDGRTDVLAPRARAKGLVIREIEEETLVYDIERNDAHCLNRAAALVWAQCNGITTIGEIVDFLRRELNPDASESSVWNVILQLHSKHLLEDQISLPVEVPGLSRRQLLQRVGMIATAAAITSLAIPTVASAASQCLLQNQSCSQNPNGGICQNCTCIVCPHGSGLICCNNGSTCCNQQCCPQNKTCVSTSSGDVCR